MELSNEQLEHITRLAAAGYSPKEVAFILCVKPSEFKAHVMNEDDPISMAYYNGLYSSELAVREQILQLARNGSSPAQTMAVKLFDETRRNLIKGGFAGTE